MDIHYELNNIQQIIQNINEKTNEIRTKKFTLWVNSYYVGNVTEYYESIKKINEFEAKHDMNLTDGDQYIALMIFPSVSESRYYTILDFVFYTRLKEINLETFCVILDNIFNFIVLLSTIQTSIEYKSHYENKYKELEILSKQINKLSHFYNRTWVIYESKFGKKYHKSLLPVTLIEFDCDIIIE